MQIKVSSLTLKYEIEFRKPFFRIADARPAFLEVMYRALVEFNIRPNDLYGFGGNALTDQRAFITLFGGNVSIDVTSEKVVANFRNASARGDADLIQACMKQILSALESFAVESPLGRETIILWPRVEVASEKMRDEFLQTLNRPKKVPTFVATHSAKVWPNYNIEIEHSTGEWLVSVTVSRAWASPTHLFVSAHGDFFTGASSQKVDDRAKIMAESIDSVFVSLGLTGATG